MLLLFTSCDPGPPPGDHVPPTPQPTVPDPFEGCPTLTHHLPVQGGLESYVFRLLALPGGDVVVGGTSVGAEALGTGPDNGLFLGGSGSWLARLGPDGVTRWAHDPGGVPNTLVRSEDHLWVAGGFSGALSFDGVDDAGGPFGGPGTFAARLDLDTGQRQRHVAIGGMLRVSEAVVEDDAGNVFVGGSFSTTTLSLDELVVERNDPDDVNGQNYPDAFLAAFDRDGAPRWLTAFGGPVDVSTEALVRDGPTLRWIVGHRNPIGTLSVSYAAEPSTHVPMPTGTTGMSVLAVDPDTGHLADTDAFWFAEEVTPFHVENQPGGGAAVYGITVTPNRWRDAQGQVQQIAGPQGELGGAVRIGPTGAVTTVRAPHAAWAWVGDMAGPLLATGGKLNQALPFADGTPQALVLGRDHSGFDGFAVLSDASDQLRCAWQVVGRGDQEVTDLAFTDDGALWVGGISRSAPYEVLDAHGDLVAAGGDDRPRGFVLRFAPTDALE